MSNIRIFYPEKLSINLEANLDKSQSYYLLKVMRIKRGDTISVFNKSGEWKSIITETIKSIVYFKVTEQLRQKEIEQEIWLAFSPIKSNYFNFMIQKATELGVTKFLPIISERTIVRKINNERLNKIIIESCEQSNRINVPTIEKSQSLEKFLSHNLDINLIFGDLNTKN
ncbi:16S rRNA (uracil(1498)-N(3))-methyltransferase, partial [Candidatus Pelagibacter sp.]|nr:16S rRNA (uracil(1498)-N(3))-methyltransferase [Candidatus Pelagibacter sp.]